jgi:hypothetical protein
VKPSIGRVVHYIPARSGLTPEVCRAAFVTEVNADPNPGDLVGLAVLNPTDLHFHQNVPLDGAEENRAAETWHWPEVVKDEPVKSTAKESIKPVTQEPTKTPGAELYQPVSSKKY